MSEYMDVVQFHRNETSGKWRRSLLGYARPSKDGTGWDCYLDALPMPGPNGCRISILPRQDRQQQNQPQSGGGRPPADMDDAIPFRAETRI